MARWNRWGEAQLDPGLPRDLTPTLDPYLDTPEVVALAGPRRAGKTTVMFQLMDRLEARGVARTAMLHLNLEEPVLAPDLGIEMLERAYRTYRERVHPSGRAWLFLDEVQAVPAWERWVRARMGTEQIKLFITGSSSALMSRELGKLLTGRHVTFRVLPLAFGEFLRFRGVTLPEAPLLAPSPPPIQHALREYLLWGGFPEVVLANDARRKEGLLKQYFDDVLYKDVALRHRVRDVPALRALAVHLLTHTASLISYQRASKMLQISLDSTKAYCGHLQEAFLIGLLPVFSRKAAVRARNPQKVHAVDVGLRNAVCLAFSPDEGHLAETAAWSALDHLRHDGLFYWRGASASEVDLVVRAANDVRAAVQVCVGANGQPVPERELAALTEIAGAHPRASRVLVVDRPQHAPTPPKGVSVVPLWRFLVGPEL